MIRFVLLSAWIGLLVVASHWMGQEAYRWFPVQASNAAPLVDDLFSLETAIGTFVFLGVLSVLLWVLLFNRAEKYDQEDGPPMEGNTRLEIVWTVIPLVIVMAIAVVSIRVNRELGVLGPMEHVHGGELIEAMDHGPGASAAGSGSLQVDVIARQWSWEFRYPGAQVSATELHLPLDVPVTFKLTSPDVLHGFYVPAFRLKQDVVPGRAIDFSLTPTRSGRYRLRDSQFSGAWFAANQADVVVESPEAFGSWLEAASHQPLQPGLSVAADEAERLARQPAGGIRWATVPPAPPPLVNVPGSNSLPHDA
ncbi:cytochrome c oxidase subunit II [Cyanobium sp. Morenito 9A2]|uniref:cytochrome c oxidase subunit II n=1 Tax=Cyanobium sp. Morenito 9A2 TaxID=2823718 RepID=UPI0020CF9D63|nr:cytochrome c oxidase subunit II [Cyanobium sp. Morenito 9A2]MCP9848553.1 cytochrome c oxidase subunit II [Cyanobium sp. Morenito 9A2]